METANEVAPVRDFANRRAFVTGAGSGIGEGIALRLAAAGARVACVDLDGAEAGRRRRELTPSITWAATPRRGPSTQFSPPERRWRSEPPPIA